MTSFDTYDDLTRNAKIERKYLPIFIKILDYLCLRTNHCFIVFALNSLSIQNGGSKFAKVA